jgi:hypothetical protein
VALGRGDQHAPATLRRLGLTAAHLRLRSYPQHHPRKCSPSASTSAGSTASTAATHAPELSSPGIYVSVGGNGVVIVTMSNAPVNTLTVQ